MTGDPTQKQNQNGPIIVGDIPFFEAAGLEVFVSRLKVARNYLEYGSGGSTILAAQSGKQIVSVESDPDFANAVKHKLLQLGLKATILVPFVGPTGEYGWPRWDRPGRLLQFLWREYPRAPFRALPNFRPDLVLVDGRFRVACALEAILHMDPKATLLVDDYIGRDYQAVEQFAQLVQMHGRMAEFKIVTGFDLKDCKKALRKYYQIPA